MYCTVSPIFIEKEKKLMNEPSTMYHAVPAVSELNRVPGFDPTRYVRRGANGPKLDLNIKKLWFRLKYPNGRIKLTTLKITDQLAIFEARVYFDKNDIDPVSSFTAKSEQGQTPGGNYIEMAQHSAVDEALSSAGFGIQFIPADSTPVTGTVPKAAPAPAAPKPAPKVPTPPPVKTAPPQTEAVVEPAPTPTPAPAKKTAPPAAASPVSKAPPPQVTVDETAPVEAPVARETAPPAASVVPETPVADAAPVETTPAESVSGDSVSEEPLPISEVASEPEVTEEQGTVEPAVRYTKDMDVETIMSIMTAEEAKEVIVPTGSCQGWPLSQVADRRPLSLKWYTTGYNGDNNILRAAAAIMMKYLESKAA